MPPTTTNASDYVRRGLLKIDEATVLSAVDSLDLRASSKVSAVVGVPLRSLQQRRDVTTFASTAPIVAVRALLELLAMDPLERVIAALGEHADAPTYDQLATAIEDLEANGSSPDELVALLTFAIGEEFPAGTHCRQLLEERPEFQLPPLPDVARTSSLLVTKEVDPKVREQRRARREEQKKKRSAASTRLARPAKVKRERPGPPPPRPQSEIAVEPVVEHERRRVQLTPAESEKFSAEHPLVGTVVLAEIAFDSLDPLVPDQRAKERPALVVAASDNALLVCGIYSNPSTTRVLFQPWRRLGFDHVSYIDHERTAIARSQADETQRLGRLTDAEWTTIS